MYNSANVSERIKGLAKHQGISVKKMLADVGLGFNTMSNMKNSMPKADNLARIADYLGCSVDYLLGRTDVPDGAAGEKDHSDDCQEQSADFVLNLVKRPSDPLLSQLTDRYSALNQEGREKLTDYADDLVTSGKYKKIDPAELGQKKG